MSQISANLSAALKSLNGPSTEKLTTPEEALRRLDLRGPAAAVTWEDVLRLDATGVERIARAVDDERIALQDAYDGGGQAVTALTHIDEPSLRTVASDAGNCVT